MRFTHESHSGEHTEGLQSALADVQSCAAPCE